MTSTDEILPFDEEQEVWEENRAYGSNGRFCFVANRWMCDVSTEENDWFAKHGRAVKIKIQLYII